MKHPLNQKQQGSKEPWSSLQKTNWEKDAELTKKRNGYLHIAKPRQISKKNRKGRTIWVTKPGKQTWIKPTLVDELTPNNTSLVIDIERCSNFGYSHIR